MSTFLAQQEFLGHSMRQGFLAGIEGEGFGDWWQMWCMGAMLNEM